MIAPLDISAELAYLTKFATETDNSDKLAREQLRALWTALCFHADWEVDTAPYDNALYQLWDAMDDAQQTTGFRDVGHFDDWMCGLLV